MHTNPTEYNLIDLPDGRKLGFSEFGDPSGSPVFYFHGFPGSRLQAADFHEIAKTRHYRFIGIDRPGMGLSTFNEQHTILSWCHDITGLANALKIDKFSIIGHSGGAPFVMACAYAIPERLISAAIVSGMAPTTLPESKTGMARGLKIINALVRNVPGLALLLMKIQQKMMLKPKVFNQLILKLPEPDRIVLQVHDRINAMMNAASEAFKQGVRGPAQELRLVLQPWGFDLNEITFPIRIWQGNLDTQVPVSHAEVYKRNLPHAKLTLCENEGHLSTLYNHMEEIFESINNSKSH